MAGEAQVKRDDETFVVAVLKDGAIRRFDRKEDVPPDAQVFDSIDSVRALKMEDLDAIRGKIMKAQVSKAKNKEEAVDLTWTALLAASANPPAAEPRRKGQRTPKVSATKFTLQYDFEKPGKSEEKFKDLPPQAKTCLEIMGRGGKKEYGEKELRELIEKHAQDLKTTQPPWRIFQYYRKRLVDESFVKTAA